MDELKRDTVLKSTFFILVGVSFGLAAMTFPTGAGPSLTTPGLVFGPKPLAGELFAQGVACSLSTGVCSMAVWNNSSTPIDVDGCHMNLVQAFNSTWTTWHTVQGVVSGPVAGAIAAHSKATVTCAVPTSELGDQASAPLGSIASGTLTVRLTADSDSFPAGTPTTIDFTGKWA